jgi:(p)ppGpp synthase/HD superfamily hydrolase
MVDHDALLFASAAHAAVGQRRKYTDEPYIVHPIAVADIVATVSDDPRMRAAALLHDVVEDTSVTLSDIRHHFGDWIADRVSELTDVSKPDDGNRQTRKRIDRDHSAAASAEGQTIKVADLIDNTKSIIQHDPNFAVRYMREKRALLNVLTKADARLLAIAESQVQAYEQAQLERALA